ncbi:hypothetical protein [Shewanella sp. GD03713]|uniref:hypothetical protein n=1 Tax=Shewanella sp. GD03713 TaxID=2975372 RepID=UPI000F6DA0D8|nr:hypothetical protein [Shewanella sp. GD03713]MDH1468988.1 hypothetical protein [Shewanella sp. GD03713]QXN24446.1 hypothetical protein KVP08_018090 [Shewanella putrefaciens]VEE62691.1 Uncharacterised protein [Shewanella putrefaciens]
MTHTSSFDIKTADDYLTEMLLPQHEDFIKNNSSSRHALLTTIIAYHMYEWVHKTKFNQASFNTNYPGSPDIAIDLEVARNITNGTKHFKNKVKTRTQSGFSSGFSDGFARPLNIEFPDGTEESADKFLRRLVSFWQTQKEQGAF